MIIADSMLKFDDVGFSTATGNPIFSGFSLVVETGEKVVVQGSSGVGKTTLLRMLLGVASPDSGEVSINGRIVDEDSCWELRHLLAYVPQEIVPLERTAREFLDYAFSLNANRDSGLDSEHLAGLMRYFELPESHLDSTMTDLSGGERQRLGLIAAILLDRDILLLDEPTASLDGVMKEKVVTWILCECRKTVLVISHDDIWARQDGGLRIVNFGGAV